MCFRIIRAWKHGKLLICFEQYFQEILSVRSSFSEGPATTLKVVPICPIWDAVGSLDAPKCMGTTQTRVLHVGYRGFGGCGSLTAFSPFSQGSVYALPYKSDLLKALEKGKEVKEEESIEKIHQFLSKATPILDAIYEMYTKMNAELTYKA